ncbi:acetamidase/formamidase family protein [Bythopirellula polymerisocia]|uniref:Acetamidase/Formamidase family protein n=1 Tax=Bythopirellula polymerisocia TaxID=2528003 RepID=A0A5C6D4X3_9BACT|nr:acetamidase/formamidase family protein [Bythopirellula polymerisocia]TWU30256.1 Acetamidase/Formamidase family protein [Bythopirellula polymerisocia]
MRTIRQPDDAYVYTLSAVHPPIASVACNETVVIETIDAFEGKLRSSSDLYSQKCPGPPRANPQTGPISVEGAKPGDTLVVHIHNIEPAESFAVTALIPEFGGLTGTSLTATLDRPLPESTRILPIEDGALRFNDTTMLPLEPFLGTLGTAPDLEAISSLVPGYWGGNMDCIETCSGSSVWLPVHNEGAIFFVGDAHARQGDGELTGVAAEMSARVTISFAVLKGRTIRWPRIETADYLMAIGSARPLEDAARIAWKELITWLAEDFAFDTLEAYQLLGLAGQMRLGNMVDPNYSMVAKISKRWLPSQATDRD